MAFNDRKVVKTQLLNASSTGNTSLVAALTNQRIRVLSVVVVSTLANSIKFQSATTDVTATYPLAANGGFVLPYNETGWFETININEALNFNMTIATATGVTITYEVIV